MTPEKLLELELNANKIRQLIIEMLNKAGSGHPGGALGMADIFSALYFYILKNNPKEPLWSERDRLVLSNGHICPVQYASLALAGYFVLAELDTLRQIDSRLQGHPKRGALPGVETTSGPLGEGLSQAIGMVLGARMDNKAHKVYCITSDGEHQEGNTWEAIMFAGKNKLNNLLNIVDRNYIQIDGPTEDIMPLDPLADKYKAFNWQVFEINGNNITEFVEAVDATNKIKNKPSVIIAHTTPGKDIDFMENNYIWHGKTPNADESSRALVQLRAVEQNIRSRKN